MFGRPHPAKNSRWFLRFPATLAPAMQADLAAGRDTSAAWTLEEIVRIGALTVFVSLCLLLAGELSSRGGKKIPPWNRLPLVCA